MWVGIRALEASDRRARTPQRCAGPPPQVGPRDGPQGEGGQARRRAPLEPQVGAAARLRHLAHRPAEVAGGRRALGLRSNRIRLRISLLPPTSVCTAPSHHIPRPLPSDASRTGGRFLPVTKACTPPSNLLLPEIHVFNASARRSRPKLDSWPSWARSGPGADKHRPKLAQLGSKLVHFGRGHAEVGRFSHISSTSASRRPELAQTPPPLTCTHSGSRAESVAFL